MMCVEKEIGNGIWAVYTGRGKKLGEPAEIRLFDRYPSSDSEYYGYGCILGGVFINKKGHAYGKWGVMLRQPTVWGRIKKMFTNELKEKEPVVENERPKAYDRKQVKSWVRELNALKTKLAGIMDELNQMTWELGQFSKDEKKSRAYKLMQWSLDRKWGEHDRTNMEIATISRNLEEQYLTA